METKYTYNGEDITIDMMFKIEHIVSILAERESKDFDVVFAEFTASDTYKALQRTNNNFLGRKQRIYRRRISKTKEGMMRKCLRTTSDFTQAEVQTRLTQSR